MLNRCIQAVIRKYQEFRCQEYSMKTCYKPHISTSDSKNVTLHHKECCVTYKTIYLKGLIAGARI